MAQTVKYLPAVQETGFDAWVGKIPWRRKWQPTPVLLPGKSRKKSFVSWSLLTQNALSAGASQPLSSSLCGFLLTSHLPVFLTRLFPFWPQDTSGPSLVPHPGIEPGARALRGHIPYTPVLSPCHYPPLLPDSTFHPL